MIPESTFQNNLNSLRNRLHAACLAAGRPADAVALLPVTKSQPIEAVIYAWRAGFRTVGENRVQEVEDKQQNPQTPSPLRWELIGHLQSNKARAAVACFDRIQSVDSIKLINKLSQAAVDREHPLPILLQVNTGRDPGKQGVAPEEAAQLLESALAASALRVEGLMTIGPLNASPDQTRRAFLDLADLRQALEASFKTTLPELSMGMSDDLEAAVGAGSTQIRVGTALFGARG